MKNFLEEDGNWEWDQLLQLYMQESREAMTTMAIPVELFTLRQRKKMRSMRDIESHEHRVIRELLEQNDILKQKMRETMKPGEEICNHLVPHLITVASIEEGSFRNWLNVMGWFRSGGYCPAYYPMWLRHSYRRLGNTLPVLEDEPASFGEGGKWKPGWKIKEDEAVEEDNDE